MIFINSGRQKLKVLRLIGFVAFFLIAFVPASKTWAQITPVSKLPIDSAAIMNWTKLGPCQISPRGKYVSYIVYSPLTKGYSFILSKIDGKWQREFENYANQLYFFGDEQTAILQQQDALHFIKLGENKPDSIVSILSAKQPQNGNGEWVAYQENGPTGELVLLNLLSCKAKRFGKVSSYAFDKKGVFLIMDRRERKDKDATVSLQLLELATGNRTTFWTGQNGEMPGDFDFSDDGKQLAFIASNNAGQSSKHSIWQYQIGTSGAVLKLRENDLRLNAGLQISGSLEFSKNGRWLFFTLVQLKAMELPKPSPDAVKIDVWSYKDRVIQPAQLTYYEKNSFKAVLSTDGDHFQQLEKGDVELVAPARITGDVVMLKREGSDWWCEARNHYIIPSSYYLKSLQDTSKSFSFKLNVIPEYLSWSPDGRWLVYYNPLKRNYFSYDIKLGKTHNLTGDLPVSVSDEHVAKMVSAPVSSPAGWIKGNNGVLLYDNYDLWQLDLSGERPAINVTKGYGLIHHIKLRLFEEREMHIYAPHDTLLITGFDVKNKYNGFIKQVLGSKTNPELLYMGPYTFYREGSQRPPGHHFDDGMKPVRASNASCWIVKRQSASEAPNYFLTSDFKHYGALTHLSPQTSYNWLTAELINYKQLDGSPAQGILYKPENFDPRKRYPVIFNYYEFSSHRLHEYPNPQFMTDNINIPWLVSRGYLVFTPDIQIKPAVESGKTVGQWAENSIVGAANYLGKLSYVDKTRMGIQGQSFGAQMTNYLVSHTYLFKAAAEMAGVSDEVSSYLSLLPTTYDNGEDMRIKEAGQIRIGATLWQHPEFYLRESAVLRADHVATPLLLVNFKLDEAVSWLQGVEFYLALRRLSKPVWLLQYDEGNHTIYNQKDAMDYTTRLTQFFDYYLKGALPPKWMTEGIPAKMKGLTTGYELDASGKKP